jgi:hypothetical protein
MIGQSDPLVLRDDLLGHIDAVVGPVSVPGGRTLYHLGDYHEPLGEVKEDLGIYGERTVPLVVSTDIPAV